MNLDEFIATQHSVIAEHGLDAYLPTLIIETRWRIKVNVLENPPEDDAKLESIARSWAEHLAKRHDYILGSRVGMSHFRVVSRVRGVSSERLIATTAR